MREQRDAGRLRPLRVVGAEHRTEVAEALTPGIDEELAAGREDMRGRYTFTIDPLDARDFDDAISCEVIGPHPPRRWRVWVHIADVTAFVRPGSPLDKEAFRRSIPLGRIGQPDDIAATIAFLVSEEAGFVSGQVVYVAGGPKD